MSSILQITCNSCGHIITSEHIHGSIIYCNGCHSYKVLTDNRSLLRPVFYKIIRFDRYERKYREMLLQYFCQHGRAKLFNQMKVTEPLRRFYVPVREINSGSKRFYVPLHESRNELFKGLFPNGQLPVTTYEQTLSERFTADLNVSDYRPVYVVEKQQRVEILPIDVSIDKVDAIYGGNREKMLVVKYLPVFTLGTNLCKVLCVGSDENFAVVNKGVVDNAISDSSEKEGLIKQLIKKGNDWIEGIGILAVLSGIFYCLYKLFTIGISGFWDIFKMIGYAFAGVLLAAWCILWLALYLVGALFIFAPILIFILSLFYREKKEKVPNEKKGRKIMNLA